MDSLVDFSPLDTSKCSVYTFVDSQQLMAQLLENLLFPNFTSPTEINLSDISARVANTFANSWIHQYQRNTP